MAASAAPDTRPQNELMVGDAENAWSHPGSCPRTRAAARAAASALAATSSLASRARAASGSPARSERAGDCDGESSTRVMDAVESAVDCADLQTGGRGTARGQGAGEGQAHAQGPPWTAGESGAQSAGAVESVDRACCLARLVRDGRVVQCKSRPFRGSSTCFQHRSARGVSRARFGLVDGDVPAAALEEFQSLLTMVDSKNAPSRLAPDSSATILRIEILTEALEERGAWAGELTQGGSSCGRGSVSSQGSAPWRGRAGVRRVASLVSIVFV